MGGVAPSGSVGTLRFPLLAGCGGGGDVCDAPVDDIDGLNANAISFDLGEGYVFGYTMPLRTLTLGSGGLTAGGGDNALEFPIPIALGAPQTWSIAGPSADVSLQSVTGVGVPLVVDFSGGNGRGTRPSLELKAGAQVGAVTGTGVGVIALDDRASLNGADGSGVSLARAAELDVIGRSSTGPLTSTGGLVDIGSPGGPSPGGTLSVDGTGNVVLDATSQVALHIIRRGRTPGKDYSQIRARGAVRLGGAYLDLLGGKSCPKLKRGDVETLVTAAGAITGRFRNVQKNRRTVEVRNGATVALFCQGAGAPPTVRIHYKAHSVTATVRRG